MPNPITIEAAAAELAQLHRENDPETTDVYMIPTVAEVRLLEITGSVGPVGDLLPFRFSARPELGVQYPSVVVLASPDEFERLKRGELLLPKDFGRWEDLKKVS